MSSMAKAGYVLGKIWHEIVGVKFELYTLAYVYYNYLLKASGSIIVFVRLHKLKQQSA